MDLSIFGRRAAWPAPEKIFALIALIGGLVLVALIPPMGGGNEQMNFQRAASIASGHPGVGPAELPGGIGDFLAASAESFPEGIELPISYSREEFQKVAALPLRADQPVTVPPNPIAVLHPISYLPQAPAIALGMWLGLSPLTIFYLGRLGGLAAGVALAFFAIRTIPIHKHGLAAIAILPTILFSRSTLDADQFTVGLAFLFLALVIREIGSDGRISAHRVAGLALAAFVLAQCKSAYLLLPLLTLAIPAERFGSMRAKLSAVAAIVLPGLIGSLAWMISLRQGYFAGLGYRTWSGIVFPDKQMAFILSDPFGYAEIVLRTVFTTRLVPKSLLDFLGLFGPPVMMPVLFYPVLATLGAGVILSGDGLASRPINRSARLLALGLVVVTVGIILTLLYLQWTKFQGPVIEGFSGRYLYPLAPLLLMFVPAANRSLFGLSAASWLVLLGIVSIGGTWWVTWATYLA